MIRTKDELIAAMTANKTHHLSWSIGNRPSDSGTYSLMTGSQDSVVVHGNAAKAALKAGLLKTIRRHWTCELYKLAASQPQTPKEPMKFDNELMMGLVAG